MDDFFERFFGVFDRIAAGIAAELAVTGQARSMAVAQSVLGIAPQALTPRVETALVQSIQDNVQLIRSIPRKLQLQIERTLLQQADGTADAVDLTTVLNEYGAMTADRVRLIANDQTRKLMTNMNAARMLDAGVVEYTWQHNPGAVTPRPLHVSYNGQTFRYDDPPVIDERTGERGIPGQAIHCHCTMRPVLPF